MRAPLSPLAKMRLAVIRLPRELSPSTSTPGPELKAIRLPAAASVPPTRLSLAPVPDLDSEVVRQGLGPGRVGAEEVGVDPVAGRAGSRDEDAGALSEAVDVQAANGDAGAGDRQPVAARPGCR